MERSTAETIVKVFAVLTWINAGLCALIALFFILGGLAFGAFIAALFRWEGFAGGVVLLFSLLSAAFFLACGLLDYIVGRALWRHKNWARILILVLAWIGAAWVALGLLMSMFAGAVAFLMQLLMTAVVGALLAFEIWFFQFEPTVKELFTGAAPSAPTPVAAPASKPVKTAKSAAKKASAKKKK